MGTDGDLHRHALGDRFHARYVSRLCEGVYAGELGRVTLGSSQIEADKDRTILLLDDDANTLLVLHAVLERTAARIIECENGDCAVQKCEELLKSVDLMVTDVVLE